MYQPFLLSMPGLLMLFLLLAGVTLLAMWIWFAVTRGRDRQRRFELLQEAVRAGKLEDDELEALRQEFRRGVASQQAHQGGRFGRFVFSLGWFAMILGVAMFFSHDRDALEAAPFVLGGGFAAITLPMALREYDRRGEAERATSGRSTD